MTSSKEDDQRWMDGLTEGELHRLRSFQLSGRINETLIEGVDFFTDLAFVATLYIFSLPSETGNYFLDTLAETVATPGSEPRDLAFFNRLFWVGAMTMLLNICIRIGIWIQQWVKYKEYITTRRDYFLFASVLPVILVEPHNGLLYVTRILRTKSEPLTEYQYNSREVKINAFMLLLEDVPQFIVQVIFWFNVKKGGLTVTWYLTTVVSVLKLLAAGTGILVTLFQLRSMKKTSATQISAKTAEDA